VQEGVGGMREIKLYYNPFAKVVIVSLLFPSHENGAGGRLGWGTSDLLGPPELLLG